MDIDRACYLLRNDRNATYYVIDECGALLWITAGFAHEYLGLEGYEISLVLMDVFLKFRGTVLSGKTVWVISVRKEENINVHACLKKHVGTTECGMNSSRITIIEKGDVLGETHEESDLVVRQGCSGIGYDIFDSTLMHGYDIGIAFNHIDPVFFPNGFLCLIDSVEFAAFMVYVGLWRIDIFLAYPLCSGSKHSSAKTCNLATESEPWKDDPTPVLVAVLSLVGSERKACPYKIFGIITLTDCFSRHCVVLVEAEPKSEFFNYVIAKSSSPEIDHTDSLSLSGVEKDVVEIITCPIIYRKHTLTLALGFALFRGEFTFFNFYPIFFSKELYCLIEIKLFDFHDEMDGITTLSACETLAEILCRRDREGRRSVVMKRTKSLIVSTGTTQCDIVGNYIIDAGGIEYFVYGALRNQFRKIEGLEVGAAFELIIEFRT